MLISFLKQYDFPVEGLSGSDVIMSKN